MQRAPLDAVRVTTAAESLEMIRSAFAGEPGPAADIIVLNAGAAIYTAGLAADLGAGVERARAILGSGAATEKMAEFVAFTNEFPG